MTDDDREPFDRHIIGTPEDEVDDPAQAFEELRQTVEDLAGDLAREMMTIRKGVEAALDGQEKLQQPIDYSTDLAQLVQSLAQVAERLHAVEKSPLLKNSPEHHARALERSGESLVKTAAQQFQSESRSFQQVMRELIGQMASARERRTQNRWLGVIGLAGGLAGILVTLFLPSLLPFSAAPRVASIVMAKTPWHAGMDLMAFDSLDTWYRIVTADQLIEANKVEINACRESAANTGKDQKCTIIVAVPET